VLPGAGALKNYGGHTAITELMGQAMGLGVSLAAVTKLRAQLAHVCQSAIQ